MIWIAGLCIFGALLWFYGACVMISDLSDNGKSLADYRKKYGKDLGMLICITYRFLMVCVWPAMLAGKFSIGLTRDIIRLISGKTPNDSK